MGKGSGRAISGISLSSILLPLSSNPSKNVPLRRRRYSEFLLLPGYRSTRGAKMTAQPTDPQKTRGEKCWKTNEYRNWRGKKIEAIKIWRDDFTESFLSGWGKHLLDADTFGKDMYLNLKIRGTMLGPILFTFPLPPIPPSSLA